MKIRREPFYGEAVDRELLGNVVRNVAFDEMADYELPSDIPQPTLEPADDLTTVVTFPAGGENHSEIQAGQAGTVHENYREIGAAIPLGFMPHRGENRRTRRAAVATWSPKDHGGDQRSGVEPRPAAGVQPPPMPTRRELLAQRQRQRRGTLDPELRRLQRRKAKAK